MSVNIPIQIDKIDMLLGWLAISFILTIFILIGLWIYKYIKP